VASHFLTLTTPGGKLPSLLRRFFSHISRAALWHAGQMSVLPRKEAPHLMQRLRGGAFGRESDGAALSME